jgi:hypothetical protein
MPYKAKRKGFGSLLLFFPSFLPLQIMEKSNEQNQRHGSEGKHEEDHLRGINTHRKILEAKGRKYWKRLGSD